MYLYRCIVIFLQVDYCLLKSQKRFELNWFNVAITTTGRLGLRWLPTVSWKVHGENENIICILISFPWARGCCVHVFLVGIVHAMGGCTSDTVLLECSIGCAEGWSREVWPSMTSMSSPSSSLISSCLQVRICKVRI